MTLTEWFKSLSCSASSLCLNQCDFIIIKFKSNSQSYPKLLLELI